MTTYGGVVIRFDDDEGEWVATCDPCRSDCWSANFGDVAGWSESHIRREHMPVEDDRSEADLREDRAIYRYERGRKE